MIHNPSYKNVIWNPVVSWQLGHTYGGVSVAIVTAHGEEGDVATLQFPSSEYLLGVIVSLTEAQRALALAKAAGFDTAAETVKGDPVVPDDLSTLDDGEDS